MRSRIDKIFTAALDLPPQQRRRFVSDACQGDRKLQDAVERLLRASVDSDPLLEPGGARKGRLWTEMLAQLAAEKGIRAGARVAQYRIIREIGRGGMAVVFLAERADGQFEQQVALKLLKLGIDTEEEIRRFEQERQIMASLNHPAIARLVDGGTTDGGRPFLIMEYVEGQPIDRYCDEHRLTIDERLRFFIDVARAVQYAHRNLVLHRDLKPSNILVTADGRVKLLDFGIAKLLDEEAGPHRAPPTRTGVRVMTPEYACPEQVRGGPMTTASDVYQLGLLLYELLTGQPPYRIRRLTAGEVERVICEQKLRLPSMAVTRGREDVAAGSADPTPEEGSAARRTRPERLRRRLRGDLDTIVLTALRKDPERRYATAEQLCQDIERHLAGRPVAARKDTLGYRVRKFLHRHTGGVLTALTVLVLIGALTGFYTTQLARERDRAQLEAEKASQVASFLKDLFDFSDSTLAKGNEISARELLDRGAERIQSELDGQPKLRAVMLTVLGEVYEKLGSYEQAAHMLEQSLEILRAGLPGDHSEVANAEHRLGEVYYQLDRYDEATALFEQSLAMRRRLLPPEHPEIASSLELLGRVRYFQGRTDEARRLLEDSLEIRRRTLEPNDAILAPNLWALADVLARQGEFAPAEEYFQEAVEILETSVGSENPRTASVLELLGSFYSGQGRNVEAAELFRRSFAIREKTLEPDHPNLGISMCHLGSASLEAGRFDEAETLLRRGLGIFERALGPEHHNVGASLIFLGDLYLTTGRHDKAEEVYLRSLAIWEAAGLPDGPNALMARRGTARANFSRGRYARAEELFRETLAGYNRSLGTDSIHAVSVLAELALAVERQDRSDEAAELYERALESARQLENKQPENPGTVVLRATTELWLGTLRAARGETEAARRLWQQARARLEPLVDSDSDVSIVALRAELLLRLGDLEAAEPHLRRLREIDWHDPELWRLGAQGGLFEPESSH